MTKPRKNDPFPNAHSKISHGKYDSYRSSRWGSYRVDPDGRIFLEDVESLRLLSDSRVAARELFDMAARHVQKIEEDISKSNRQRWENFEKDSGHSALGWTLSFETGEFEPPEEPKADQ